MTAKRFQWVFIKDNELELRDNGIIKRFNNERLEELLNALHEENEQLKNKLKDWHQRTFEAHEYFNILEKVIDEVCDDDINNQIWKEYEKRERLIE